MESGETEIEAAYRETQEEAGLAKEQLTLLNGFEKVLRYEVKGKPKKVVYWLAEVTDVNVVPKMSHEHQNFEWAALADALKLAAFPDMQQVLTEADDFIKKQV